MSRKVHLFTPCTSENGGGHSNPPVFLPGESPGQRNLAGYSPRGCEESDMTEATEYAH